MKPPIVDQIMQEPVYSVDANYTVEHAVNQMRQHNIKKILVKQGGRPEGVLESWMITKHDYQKRVKEMELRPFGRTPTGSELTEVKGKVGEFTAVYVHSPENQDEFVGVVTSYDLVRAL